MKIELEARKVRIELELEANVPKGANDYDINERLEDAVNEGDISFVDLPINSNAVIAIYVVPKEGESN